jgi:glucose-6-phosphate isomerase
MIEIDLKYAESLVNDKSLADAHKAEEVLKGRKGPGNDFLGWIDLPDQITSAQLDQIQATVDKIRSTEALVVIGIGGSYLGARAVIEALSDTLNQDFPIYYAGHHLDSGYHNALLKKLSNKKYSIAVISKSGTTTEPGIAFRLLWNDLEKRYGHNALKDLVFAITDQSKGALKKIADSNGLHTFVIPDDVGGRYSVLTPVGLLPVAAAGIDIKTFVKGAQDMKALILKSSGMSNPALVYAAYRNAAYRSGKKIEIMAGYQPGNHFVSEWWKQLYGESEGKNNKGIFPASVDFSTDLHSMGQWIQEGERIIFQTVIDIKKAASLIIPSAADDGDGLNYLAGRELHEVNRVALMATMEAHASGGVPIARLILPEMDPWHLGGLMYMFEYACGISAYMLEVNPFDQPGVEAYKKNMFRMLGKPGS